MSWLNDGAPVFEVSADFGEHCLLVCADMAPRVAWE